MRCWLWPGILAAFIALSVANGVAWADESIQRKTVGIDGKCLPVQERILGDHIIMFQCSGGQSLQWSFSKKKAPPRLHETEISGTVSGEIAGIGIGDKCAGNKTGQNGQNVKGSEHTSNQSPSNLEKHQKGQAAKVNNAKVNDWKAYNKKGGKLSKTAWEKAGQPRK
jgi:hypothetical protein